MESYLTLPDFNVDVLIVFTLTQTLLDIGIDTLTSVSTFFL